MATQQWPTRSVRSIIESSIEPLSPQADILAFLFVHDGKRLDKRLLAKLNEAVPGHNIRTHQIASMTSLHWGNYGRAEVHQVGEDRGGSLLIAYRLTDVRIDAAWVEEHNAAYFSAAVARNEKRAAALANPQAIDDLERTLATFIEAKAKLNKAFEYGAPFATDGYTIQKAYNVNLGDYK